MIPLTFLCDEYIDRPKLSGQKNSFEYIVPPPTSGIGTNNQNFKMNKNFNFSIYVSYFFKFYQKLRILVNMVWTTNTLKFVFILNYPSDERIQILQEYGKVSISATNKLEYICFINILTRIIFSKQVIEAKSIKEFWPGFKILQDFKFFHH